MAKFKKANLIKPFSLVMAITLSVSIFASCGKPEEEPTTTEAPITTTEPAPVIRNPLTGEEGYNEDLLKNRPVIVTVENHPQARPQWGLTSSDIVMEMVAEGGITRMLLMYADASRLPEKVGPTRSARHYFVDLAEGFDAIFVHFGYSPAAKSQINNHNVDNINGLVDGSYFSRDKSRNVDSEHTAYTTKENIEEAIVDKGYRTTLNDGYENPFNFNESAETLNNGTCVTTKVSFSQSYTYTFNYDKQENVYYSQLNGNDFMDANGTQQNFENIIVLYTDISAISGDTKNRVDFDLSNGTGTYISNGSYCDIKWSKGESDDMLKLYDENDDELSLNIGRSYIAILDNDRKSACTIE